MQGWIVSQTLGSRQTSILSSLLAAKRQTKRRTEKNRTEGAKQEMELKERRLFVL